MFSRLQSRRHDPGFQIRTSRREQSSDSTLILLPNHTLPIRRGIEFIKFQHIITHFWDPNNKYIPHWVDFPKTSPWNGEMYWIQILLSYLPILLCYPCVLLKKKQQQHIPFPPFLICLKRAKKKDLWDLQINWSSKRKALTCSGWWLTYPSEKWWSECQIRMMTFQPCSKFQTTNHFNDL